MKSEIVGHTEEVKAAPTWDEIFSTNWHKLHPKDASTWIWQIKNELPDVTVHELVDAVTWLSRQLCENKDHPRTPKPRDIVNAIRQAAAVKSQTKSIDAPRFDEHSDNLCGIADTGNWLEVNNYLFKHCANDEVNRSLRSMLKRKYPDYRREWSVEHCLAYEGLRNKRCPFWPKGITPPAELGRLKGSFFVPEKDTPTESVYATEIGPNDPF